MSAASRRGGNEGNGARSGKASPARNDIQATVAERWSWRKGTGLGGVQGRPGSQGEDVADFDQQVLDGTTAGQVRFDAILVLDEANGDLEQFQDDRGGLGLRQLGAGQHLGPQGVVEHIRRAGEEQAQAVGEEAVVGGAVADQVLVAYSRPWQVRVAAGSVWRFSRASPQRVSCSLRAARRKGSAKGERTPLPAMPKRKSVCGVSNASRISSGLAKWLLPRRPGACRGAGRR